MKRRNLPTATRTRSVGVVMAAMLCATVCVVLLALSVIFFHPGSVYPRTSIVIVADPMLVFTWDWNNKRAVVLAIPAEAQIEGVYGYGRYSLEALWKLGDIEKKGGSLLSDSIQETLGIPINGYVGPAAETLVRSGDPMDAVHSALSILKLPGSLFGRYRANVPIPLWLALVWQTKFVGLERITIVPVRSALTLDKEVLPDGSTVSIVDTEAVDEVLGNNFEEERLRKEKISVAVYNTTTTPALSTRVARLLNHIGLRVVAVGNDTPQIDTCTVAGSEDVLGSATARVILELYGCEKKVQEEDRADLVVRVGSIYEKRFYPWEEKKAP